MATTIKIGHASWSENQSANGAPGDTDDKEVYISENYDVVSRLEPTHVLRPRSKAIAEKSAKACEDACNNPCVGYSQSGRETFYLEAEKVEFDISKIKTKCNTDCSAFMAACAVAGGAKKSINGTWPPAVSGLVERFKASEQYDVFTGAKYLKSTDYLKRGDILLHETVQYKRHCMMVLSNGDKIHADVFLDVTLTDIGQNTILFKASVIEVKDGERKEITETEILNAYSWKYELVCLSNTNSQAKSVAFTMATGSASILVANLEPNSSYILRVIGTQEKESISSQNILFTTLKATPTAVENLSLNSSVSAVFNGSLSVSFSAPKTWNDQLYTSATRGYRLYLLVNSKIVGYTDTLITDVESYFISKVISTQDIFDYDITEPSIESINLYDTLQVGIQPWLKDNMNNLIFDAGSLRCSRPLYLKHFLNTVDKPYVKIKDDFKRTLVHNNLEGIL